MKSLFILLLCSLTQPLSAQTSCQDLFAAKPFQKNEIDWVSVLAELPDLQSLMTDFMKDEKIPLHLKAKLKRVFKDDAVEIRNFSSDLKNFYGFSKSLAAFASNLKQNYQVRKSTAVGNFNDQIDTPFSRLAKDKKNGGWIKKDFFLMIQNGKVRDFENPILILAHELAHVRMDLFLNKHIESLLGQFPSDWLSREPNGKIVADSNFISYLHERYAHEIEFQTMKALVQKKDYAFQLPPVWEDLRYFSDDMLARAAIAQAIRVEYKLNDERLGYLDSKRLHTILTKGLDRRLWIPR